MGFDGAFLGRWVRIGYHVVRYACTGWVAGYLIRFMGSV